MGRSFVVCSHDPIFRTYKESSIWCQNDHKDIMQNLSAAFIFQEECRMKIEHVLFLFVFSKLRIRVSEGHFQRVHTIRLSEPTKFCWCGTYILLGTLVLKYNLIFLCVLRVSDKPLGKSNTERREKNGQYFKRKHLIIYLLSNSKFHPRGKNFGVQN